MGRGTQIDKISKEVVTLSKHETKNVKKQHHRFLRKFAKDINNPNPQFNRYNGYIG